MATNPQEPSHAEMQGSLSVGDIVAYLRHRWFIFLGIPFLTLSMGAAWILLARPIYRSEAVLLPVLEDGSSNQLGRLAGQLGGLASLAGVNVAGTASTNEGLATLRSRDLAARFIEQANLMPILFFNEWDEEADAWRDEPPTVEEAIKLVDEDIRTVFEDKDNGLVLLRVEWHDRALVSAWARELVAMANEQLRNKAIAEARASIAFLDAELRGTSVIEVQQSIYSLMESETKKIMLANVRPEYAFRVIDSPRTPDADDQVWPNAPLILAVSMLLGLGLVVLIAVVKAPQGHT